VGNRELLRDVTISRGDVLERLCAGRWPRRPRPILVEEFIRPEDGRAALPLECKVHTFCGEVAAIQVVERRAGHDLKARFYTSDWEPIHDPMSTLFAIDERLRTPPECMDGMLELSAKLGAVIGTYMRIDFFVTGRGCVFNEVSSVPGGATRWCTPYCDELFGRWWMRTCPHAT
jgi:teichuronopeptide biosynthesis TupA-like protein